MRLPAVEKSDPELSTYMIACASTGRSVVRVEGTPRVAQLPASVLDSVGAWRKIMRTFIAACFVAALIALSAAAVLDNFVQQSSSAAFSEPGVRIS